MKKMQPGFMIYTAEWEGYIEDFSSEEAGELLKALISHFLTGELTEFPDRGMRQFYRRAVRVMEDDRRRYEEKCSRNAYSRYCGICRQKGVEPAEYEEWVKDGDERQDPSTDVTNTNTNNNTNTSNNISNSTNTSINNSTNNGGLTLLTGSGKRRSQREMENDFEAKRNAVLNSLSAMHER